MGKQFTENEYYSLYDKATDSAGAKNRYEYGTAFVRSIDGYANYNPSSLREQSYKRLNSNKEYKTQFDNMVKQGSIPKEALDFSNNNKMDYDYAAAFMVMKSRGRDLGQADNGHWTDAGKLPHHATFSTDSFYAQGDYKNVFGDFAGTWRNQGNEWTYEPASILQKQLYKE